MADVCADGAAVWWVKPNYLSLSRSILTGCLGIEVKLIVVSAVFESMLVGFGGRVEGMLVFSSLSQASLLVNRRAFLAWMIMYFSESVMVP